MATVNLGSPALVAAGRAARTGRGASASAVVALRLNARASDLTDTPRRGDFSAVNTAGRRGARVR
ncbi:MAG TPA: hypothetical protein VFW96_28225 [Thermomicrobiales bacterium]|nr:hypothetical protein [Thermomicrobiales bacterium]